MIITEKFIFAHLPKTGGTFIRNILMELYGIDKTNLPKKKIGTILKVMLSGYNRKGTYGKMGILPHQHTPCRFIPPWLRNRPIFSAMRNPFDYYVSQYEFGWWKKPEYHGYYKKQIPNFESLFPAYPDLSFKDYLKLDTLLWNPKGQKDFEDKKQLGPLTYFFVNFYFKRPKQVFKKIASEKSFISSGQYKKNLIPIHFIYTHELNQQLYQFLYDNEFPTEQIAFIKNRKKILPMGKGRTKEQKWQNYYSDELIALVQEKDQLVFDLFPQFKQV